jgi:hypothetical protein
MIEAGSPVAAPHAAGFGAGAELLDDAGAAAPLAPAAGGAAASG